MSQNNTIQEDKKVPSKRVNIVSVKMVKESSILYSTRKVSSPREAVNLLRDFLKDSDREKFVVCCLDSKCQPTCIEVVSIGTLDSANVHPREVFKTAILSNARSIIAAHNHPSGSLDASSQDISITKRLKEAGKILGISLIDHIIITDSNFRSLKESGYLDE